MNRVLRSLALLLVFLVIGSGASADQGGNLFFLHHSTGRYLIEQGGMRAVLADFNAQHGAALEFWDHDYNHIGLSDAQGENLGYSYGIPGDNTDPDGLWVLWTTENAARDSILANHDVIAFKSCYPASDIQTDAELQQRQAWYLEMRDVFDQHPGHTFVVVSQPPRHRLATSVEEADRARAFASWLVSAEYLAGHPNVIGFDLFDHLAHPDDGSDGRNQLRWEYERDHGDDDSHPNQLANETVGPIFMQALAEAGLGPVTTAVDPRPGPVPGPAILHGSPNPFNPRVEVAFELPAAGPAVIRVVDVRGRRVATLHRGDLPAGRGRVAWDGTDDRGARVPSGVYLVRLLASGRQTSHAVTLVE